MKFNFLKPRAVNMLSHEHKKKILQNSKLIDQDGIITNNMLAIAHSVSPLARSYLEIENLKKGDLYTDVLSKKTIDYMVYESIPRGPTIFHKKGIQETLIEVGFPEKKIRAFLEKYLAEDSSKDL